MVGTAVADNVVLKAGDVLHGTVTQQTEGSVVLDHPVLGTLTIDRAQIDSLEVEQSREAAQTVAEAAEEDEQYEDTLLYFAWPSTWERTIDIGFNGAEGKSENLNLRAGFLAEYKDDRQRWHYEMVYARQQSEGEVSENDFFADLSRDWARPHTPWFGFAEGRFDWDEFKEWDYRISGSGGVGYEFLKNDAWLLTGRAGLGGNRTFGGERDETTPEGLLGVRGRWRLNGQQSLRFRSTFYPALNDIGEFRNISTLDWVLSLNPDKDFGLKLGMSNEYDSQNTDADKNDFKYYGSLLWGL